MFTDPVFHVTLLVVASLTTTALAVYSLRSHDIQGARPFTGLMLAFTVYSATHLVGLLTHYPPWRMIWENIQWIGIAAIPLFWMVFAMEYTGYDEWIDWRTVGALSVVPAVTVLFVWTNEWHWLMWSYNVVSVVDGLAIMDQEFGPWFWVFIVYTYGIIIIGSFFLVRLIWLSDRLYMDQALLLVTGVAIPLFASVLTVLDATPIRDPVLDLTPYSFAATGVAFGYALFRGRLFELVPATRRLGRNTAIAQLKDGIVITDANRQIIYLNPAAGEILAYDPADALGRSVDSLLSIDPVTFKTEDAVATVDRDDRVYEVRTSPITNRRDRLIGHTFIIHEVTTQKERERQLAKQRDELKTLDRLNAVIRGVNEALVSATTREDIERAVCDQLTDSGLYRTAFVAGIPTWRGDADHWTVGGVTEPEPPSTLRDEEFDPDPDDPPIITTTTSGNRASTWMVVPLAHGRTVYGALALSTDRNEVIEREREVLAELGGVIGHAINAVEGRRLLAAEAVVELEFDSTDEEAALAAASDSSGGRLDVTGFVPGDDHVAYVRVEGEPAECVGERLATVTDGSVRTVRTTDKGGLLEWQVTGDVLLGVLVDHGSNVLSASAENGTARIVVEVASDADVRSLLDHVTTMFPETRLEAKRERERPVEEADSVPRTAVKDLTDRQQDVIEAAYRAGYFDWPRESTAEEVADALDIAAPTLHAHLRKAEATLLTELFETNSEVRSD